MPKLTIQSFDAALHSRNAHDATAATAASTVDEVWGIMSEKIAGQAVASVLLETDEKFQAMG